MTTPEEQHRPAGPGGSDWIGADDRLSRRDAAKRAEVASRLAALQRASARRRTSRQLGVVVLQAAVLLLVVTVVRVLLEEVTGRSFSFAGSVVCAVLLLAGWRISTALAPRAQEAPEGELSEAQRSAVAQRRRPLARLETLETRLASDARRGQHHYERTIRPSLVAVVADRLRRHHGVDLETEPARARAITGEELWELIVEPWRAEAPAPERLSRALAVIEQL